MKRPSHFLICLLVLLPCWASAKITLRASQASINLVNKQPLEIECFFDEDAGGSDQVWSEVKEMQIMRVPPGGRPQTLVKISATQTEQNFQGFTVSGTIAGGVSNVYLKLAWGEATQEELGAYRCDLVGTNDYNEYQVAKTNVVELKEDLIARVDSEYASLRVDFNRYRNETQVELDSLNVLLKQIQDAIDVLVARTTVPDADCVVDALTNLTDTVSANVLKDVTEQVNTVSCSDFTACGGDNAVAGVTQDEQKETPAAAQSNEPATPAAAQSNEPTTQAAVQSNGPATQAAVQPNEPATQAAVQPNAPTTQAAVQPVATELTWPSGNFGLLKSRSGCPGDDFQTGYVGLHTESVDINEDEVSEPNHLAEPVRKVDLFYNSMLYMHFCVQQSSSDTLSPQPWPQGSYCINRVSGVCPQGFSSGSIDIDEEDENHQGEVSGVVADMIFYCCRNDGPADSPVALPTSSPFYLYRYGGQCQAVEGMTTAPEYMVFDSENNDNEDKYENDFHPDGQLRNVRIELCYYS